MSNIVNKKNSIVKKENIESECTKNREETKNKSGKEIKVKICPISYDELGENGEYILKDDGYCFNYNSIIDKKTREFRPNMDKNPMNNKQEWSKTFKDTLFIGIPKRITKNLIRKNGIYRVEGEDNPCCTKCKPAGCISNCIGRTTKCNTCDENFKPTKIRKPCERWLSTGGFDGGGTRKKRARKKRGFKKKRSKKKRKRHRKKNTAKKKKSKKRRTFKRKYRKTKKKKKEKNKKSTKKGGDWGDICPICQEKMEKWSYKTIALCPCNHEFHRKCIVKWLKSQKNNNDEEGGDKYELTCPVCRNPCTIKSLKKKARLFKIPKMSLKKRKIQPERVITPMRRQFQTQQRRDNNTRIVPQSTRDYTDFWNNVE